MSGAPARKGMDYKGAAQWQNKSQIIMPSPAGDRCT